VRALQHLRHLARWKPVEGAGLLDNVRRRRRAARIILIDNHGRTLLFRGVDPVNASAGPWWFTPGGGCEGEETDEQTARREVYEETGLRVTEMSSPVHTREFDIVFAGEPIHQMETYFVARVPAFEPHSDGWTDLERQTILDHRWWSAAEIEASAEHIYPGNLADLIREHAKVQSSDRGAARPSPDD
jgi:8-oxo-dGTP pyrophosphatase MutT (NUDIX family)